MPHTVPTGFSSVKLPAALVEQARAAAQPMRRSVAGQIEYWATLGRALENAGLTATDSSALIAREDVVHYAVKAAPVAAPSAELQDLQAHVLALATSGTLNARARAAVADNRAKAAPRGRSRKAA